MHLLLRVCVCVYSGLAKMDQDLTFVKARGKKKRMKFEVILYEMIDLITLRYT